MIHFRHRSRSCQILRKKFSKTFEIFAFSELRKQKDFRSEIFEMGIYQYFSFLLLFEALILNQTTSGLMETFSEHDSRIFRFLPRLQNMEHQDEMLWYYFLVIKSYQIFCYSLFNRSQNIYDQLNFSLRLGSNARFCDENILQT